MKKYITLLLISISILSKAQDKMLTKNGIVTFEASVPSFEEIKAKSNIASCIVNTNTGEIAALVLVKSFRFKIALMEEHFNENYIESDKYPKATFKGKIEGFNYSKITTEAKDFKINGKLELHGKSKDITIIAKIKRGKDGLEILSNFSVNSDDFDIKIPSVVSKKVSKKVNIELDFILK
ncbi:YceI family protein [Flavobacterium tibetense]|uniref:YceI family protein n=1 Tax=Flavobacterium tibetense TaxID=2233533 RepID=A0A365P3Z7_9FLAO|nr:YceI family protein [Flavobacterium tibetense]RBA29292.1 YceI family protein [Flavobacterium tibetense]